MLTWLNDESQAREIFQSTVLNRLGRSEQIIMLTYWNSLEQLVQQKKSIKLQILALQNQGISVPQLTEGSAVEPLQIEMNGQPQRLPSFVAAQESCHPSNHLQIMKNFNNAYLSSKKQQCVHEQVTRTLKAAAGGSTEGSIKMPGWDDFKVDANRRQVVMSHGGQLVNNTRELKRIPQNIEEIAACTIQNAMKNKYLKKESI